VDSFALPGDLTVHQVFAITGVPFDLTHVWLSLVHQSLSNKVMTYLDDPKRFSSEDTPPSPRPDWELPPNHFTCAH